MHSTVSHSLHLESTGSLLIITYCKKNLLWWGLREVLIYGHKVVGSCLILDSFSRITIEDYLSGAMNCPATVSWHRNKRWSPSCGVDFKSNRKVVGYFITFVPLLHQLRCLARVVITVAHRVYIWLRLMSPINRKGGLYWGCLICRDVI